MELGQLLLSTISGLEEFEEKLEKYDDSKAEKNEWLADMLRQIRDREPGVGQTSGGNKGNYSASTHFF